MQKDADSVKTGYGEEASDFSSHDWGHRTTCGLQRTSLGSRTVVLTAETFVLGKEGVLDSGFLTAFKSFW